MAGEQRGNLDTPDAPSMLQSEEPVISEITSMASSIAEMYVSKFQWRRRHCQSNLADQVSPACNEVPRVESAPLGSVIFCSLADPCADGVSIAR